jgi:hypothetical protein
MSKHNVSQDWHNALKTWGVVGKLEGVYLLEYIPHRIVSGMKTWEASAKNI